MDFEGIHAVVTGGRTGLIPEWVSDRSKEYEVSIELPKNSIKMTTSWELLYSSILFIFLLLMMIRQDMTLLTTMV